MSNKFIFGIGCLTALGALFLVLGIAVVALGVASVGAGTANSGEAGGAVIFGAPSAAIGAGVLAWAYLLVRRHPPAAGDEGENKAPQSPTGVPRPPGALQ